MVRKYTDKKIPAELTDSLNARIEEHNKKYGLNLKLVIGNADGVAGIAKLLLAKEVNNYFVLAGTDTPDLDEKLGYCGADLILYAQTLGLNTWWVGGMYNGNGAKKNLENQNVRVNGVIAVGYGQTQGVQHKMKTAEEIIAFLEAELSEAIEMHDATTDKAQRLSLMLKAYTISELLDEIKA